MAKASYELVAHVGKARGLEGEVTATTVGDLPFFVREGLHVHVVPPSLYGPRQLDVSEVIESGTGGYRLRFDGVDSIDDAELIAGRYLLANVADLEDFEEFDSEIGLQVMDERYGDLGTIEEIIETPANDVWVVRGARGEVLIPVIDDVIVSYPEDPSDPLVTHVMDGLIEE